MSSLVSIIMPVRNTAPFLKACLDSIVAQTYTQWELIAVNDHSTDESLTLLTAYADQDNRITVLQNKGKGIIPALQTGYAAATGEFITRMDSDDIMESNKLEVLLELLVDSGKGHLATGKVHYFSDQPLGEGFQKYEAWLNRLTEEGENFSEIYKECVIPSPCWMLYREDFEQCGGFESDIYPEDYDLVFRFFTNGLKVIPCNKVLHYWRDYSTRTSRTHEHYADSSFIEIKLKYFLGLHHDPAKNLVIWGAGAKGKRLAELLLELQVEFRWICDNPKKIGKHIYGEELWPFTAHENIENSQSIISVASPRAQIEIKKYFRERGLKSYEDYFFFC